MKPIRILKNLSFAAMIILVIFKLAGYKFPYITQITFAVIAVAAISFFLNAFLSGKSRN